MRVAGQKRWMFRFATTAFLSLSFAADAQTDNPPLETQVWNYATGEDSIEAFELFIFTFPDSDLVAIAENRLAELKLDSGQLVDEAEVFKLVGNVTYDGPLAFGAPEIIGKTFTEILGQSPLYPPIEGLPDAVWKEQTCAGCHQWQRDDLCTQATTYIAANPAQYQEKLHPFGGTLKINLRNWAQNDCR